MIRNLLIIDDSPVARKILRKCLPDQVFDIREAPDGAQGLTAFIEKRPDVTFLDLTMPVMDGFTALAEMMKIDPTAIIIICTADVQEKVQTRVMNLGAFHIIKKPPSKAIISQVLEQAENRLAGQAGTV